MSTPGKEQKITTEKCVGCKYFYDLLIGKPPYEKKDTWYDADCLWGAVYPENGQSPIGYSTISQAVSEYGHCGPERKNYTQK